MKRHSYKKQHGCGAFFFFWHATYILVNKQEQVFRIHSNVLFRAHTEAKLHPKTYLSSPSTTPKAAWATLVTLGSYQPIICPAANTVCKCTDCKEQIPTSGSQPLLLVQFSSQLYLLHNAAFTMRLKMFLASQKNSTSESSTCQRLFLAYRSSNRQIPITAQIQS